MKKKLLTVMMAVMMAFSLSGCGNDVIVDVVTNDVESGSNQTDVSNLGTAQESRQHRHKWQRPIRQDLRRSR